MVTLTITVDVGNFLMRPFMLWKMKYPCSKEEPSKGLGGSIMAHSSTTSLQVLKKLRKQDERKRRKSNGALSVLFLLLLDLRLPFLSLLAIVSSRSSVSFPLFAVVRHSFGSCSAWWRDVPNWECWCECVCCSWPHTGLCSLFGERRTLPWWFLWFLFPDSSSRSSEIIPARSVLRRLIDSSTWILSRLTTRLEPRSAEVKWLVFSPIIPRDSSLWLRTADAVEEAIPQPEHKQRGAEGKSWILTDRDMQLLLPVFSLHQRDFATECFSDIMSSFWSLSPFSVSAEWTKQRMKYPDSSSHFH